MRILARTSLALALLFASGCLVPDVQLEGKACGDAGGGVSHACAEGYVCMGALTNPLDVGTCVPAGSSVDSGSVPVNSGSLSGPFTFPVRDLYSSSHVSGGLGQDVTALLAENPILCGNYDSTPGWVLDLDLTQTATQAAIAPNVSYALGINDAGPGNSIQGYAFMAHNLPDGGQDLFVEAGRGISGDLTVTKFDPSYIAGSFSLQVAVFPDGGRAPDGGFTSQITGSFTANSSACP